MLSGAAGLYGGAGVAQEADDEAIEDEIVVTARLRAETLQDVPIAVTAFNEAGLDQQQVDDLLDLSSVVPTLSIAPLTGGSIAQIYLRGAGQDDSSAASEPPISIYLDGVPYTKSPGAIIDLIEFERIEALRGPQGTLYGRNSTGGALKFETRRPDLDEGRVVGDVTIGSNDRLDLRAALSAPVSDTLALKLDLLSRTQDGFLKDAFAGPGNDRPRTYNDVDTQTARLGAYWEPTDQLSVYATTDVTRSRPGPQATTPGITGAASASLDVSGDISQARPLYATRVAAPTLARDQAFDGYGAMVRAEYEAVSVLLTSILGYRGFELSQGIDTDSGPNVLGITTQTGEVIDRGFGFDFVRDWENDTFSWEGRLTSLGDGPLTWVAGVFALHERNRSDDVFGRFSEPAPFQFASAFSFDQTTRSLSAFGEGSYEVTDRLTLTAGGRITWDEKELDRTHQGAFGLGPLGVPYEASAKEDWSQFTPRLIADFELAPDVSVYASYARGFQAGAFQSFPFSPTTANEPFDPTKVDSYEVGLRSQFWDRRVTANITGFWADYTDLPSTINSTDGVLVVLTNDVRLAGLEFELSARPTDSLDLYAIVGLTDDDFTRSVVGPSEVPGETENRLKYVSDVTARVGGSYTYDLPRGDSLTGTVNATHTGDFFMSTVNTPFAFQDAYTTLGAELRYVAPDARWQLALGGRNLTDELYRLRASAGQGGNIAFADPETWYLRLRYEM